MDIFRKEVGGRGVIKGETSPGRKIDASFMDQHVATVSFQAEIAIYRGFFVDRRTDRQTDGPS